jgi:hypothetical protein
MYYKMPSRHVSAGSSHHQVFPNQKLYLQELKNNNKASILKHYIKINWYLVLANKTYVITPVCDVSQ